MTIKKLISICIIMAAGAAWNACSGAMQPEPQANREPTVKRVVPTVQPTATAIVLPAPTGEPVRVEFDRGSHGATLTGNSSTQYLLWAKAGQTFKAAMLGTGYSTLRSVDGTALYEQAWAGTQVTATLAATGDHLLEIRSSGQFTAGVEIQ